MIKEKFVLAINRYVGQNAIKNTIEELDEPIGNPPTSEMLKLSQWFRNLEPSDRANVIRVMKEVTESTLFGFFCVLDNVRIINDSENESDHGDFELYYATQNGKKWLNNPGEDAELHDLFKAIGE